MSKLVLKRRKKGAMNLLKAGSEAVRDERALRPQLNLFRSPSRGFTLVEAVISATILSVTMLVATLAFTTIVQLQQKAATVRQVQQSTRYIVEMISRDVRNTSTYELTSTLILPNSLNPKEDVRYSYDPGSEAVRRARVRCDGGTCTPVVWNDLTEGQIRVIEFRMEEVSGAVGPARPIRIYIKSQQSRAGLAEEDPYFYEYETTALVVPR